MNLAMRAFVGPPWRDSRSLNLACYKRQTNNLEDFFLRHSTCAGQRVAALRVICLGMSHSSIKACDQMRIEASLDCSQPRQHGIVR